MSANSLFPCSSQKLFSYVVARDYGFAPNPFSGYCTLATCKPDIREKAEIGNWIIGTSSQESHHCTKKLVFAMRVKEVLSFNEYWNDERFQIKKPNFNASEMLAYGDNIYHHENGKWKQEISHHRPNEDKIETGNLQKDTSADKVLISDKFVYFGSNPIEIPESLNVVKRGQGHRCKFAPQDISIVSEWLEKVIIENEFTPQQKPAKWDD